MINLETRKKLEKVIKNIDEFCDYACFDNESSCVGKCCKECEYYLLNPTLEELIEAVDEKTNVKWGFERQKENGSWLVWFKQGELKSMTQNRYILASEDLDDCLAIALIWLYKEEEEMLICKIFVNEEEIDEIKIQRIEDFKGKDSWHKYKIIKPKGYEKHIILHRYSDERRVLLANALKYIKEA